MAMSFESEVAFWRGPAPFLFAQIPTDKSKIIKRLSHELSYGWGCIPVSVKVGESEWKTSLFPKDGTYLVPIKPIVRRAESIEVGAGIKVKLDIVFR